MYPTVRELAAAVAALPHLDFPPDGGETSVGLSLRLLLELKAIPELRPGSRLPMFVGVQGGTNVGKSTVFNALAGKLLSPSTVEASSTKHPLVFAHEVWRCLLADPSAFPGFDCRELSDPKELLCDATRTELLYFRFHPDASLEHVALIDSPDFDGTLETNLEVARRVTALSDVTVFVTTAQKYRDRELVKHLRVVRDLKAELVVVFNMVDTEIVFQTLVDDLHACVPVRDGSTLVLRIPSFASARPEEEVRSTLLASALPRLTGLGLKRVKQRILERTLRRVVHLARMLVRGYATELGVKKRFEAVIGEELAKAVSRYQEAFSLALPEETLAIRKLLSLTELSRWIELGPSVKDASVGLKVLSRGLIGVSTTLRRLFLRLSRCNEGLIDDSPAALAEYADARDRADLDGVLRSAGDLRLALDTFLRSHERASPLASSLLGELCTPSKISAFPALVQAEFRRHAGARPAGVEDIAARVDRWIDGRPVQRRLFATAAVSLKLACGVGLAFVVPPDGLLSPWNWIHFVLGYLLAAYALALGVSLALRRTGRLRRLRSSAMQAVLGQAVLEPFRIAMDRMVSNSAVERISELARGIEAELPATSDHPTPT